MAKKIYKHHQRTTIAQALSDAQARELVISSTERQVGIPFADGNKLIINDWYDARAFGAVIDGTTDDYIAIQAALNAANSAGKGIVYLPAGTYYVSTSLIIYSNTWLRGAGIGKTILNYKANYTQPGIKTPVLSPTALTQTSDISIGDTTNIMTSPGSLAAGDIIYYENSQRFTAEWDSGVAIRAYYTNKEHFRVKSVSGTTITFDEAAALAQPVSTKVAASYFTPTTKVKITDLEIQYDAQTVLDSGHTGIDLRFVDGAEVGHVRILRTNNAGISTDYSTDITLHDIWTVGGRNDATGNQYGIVNAGSKHVSIKNTFHRHHRHGIATGTATGGPIPMYQSAINVHVQDSLTSESVDCHAGSYRCDYDHIYGDQGLGLSGIGHSATNIYCEAGILGGYEGGTDQVYSNVYFKKINRLYSNSICYRIKFIDCTLNFKNFDSTTLNGSSKFIEFHRCKIYNRAFMDSSLANIAAADATITAGWTDFDGTVLAGTFNNSFGVQVFEGGQLIDCEIHGFPTGFRVIGYNATARGNRIINCGWNSVIAGGSPQAFYVNTTSQGSRIDDTIVEFYKTNISNSTTNLSSFPGGGVIDVSICGVRYGFNHDAAKNYAQAVYLPAGSYITLRDWHTTCTSADTLTATTGVVIENVNGLVYRNGTIFQVNSTGQFVQNSTFLGTLLSTGNFTVNTSSKFFVQASTGNTDIGGTVTISGNLTLNTAIASTGAVKVGQIGSVGNSNNPRLDLLLQENTKDIILKMNGSAVPNAIIFQDSSANVLWTLFHTGVLSSTITTDSTTIATGALVVAGGIGVAKRITLDGGTGKTLKIVNGVANAAVAVTLGAGPTGSTAGNPQGWMRIDINGTDRYIPYW